jgi:peptidoglycan/LPS O-acetylase OafA/YrhL
VTLQVLKRTPKARFAFIDGLRGIAAIAVVLFHAQAGDHIDLFPKSLQGAFSYGELGVSIFFVISGFVITHSLRDLETTPLGISRFVLRRSMRLDPPYWVAIFVTISFSVISSKIVHSHIVSDYSGAQILAHVFYLQEFMGYPEISSVFWTLCYEIQFYIVFSFLLCSNSKVLITAVYIASIGWPAHWVPEVRGLFANLFYQFLLGAGAYWAWIYPKSRAWFLLYLAIVLGISWSNGNKFGLMSSLTALVILAVALRGELTARLKSFLWQRLGLISYSLYLIHNPVSGASFRVWYILFGRSPTSEVSGLAITVIACLCVAALMYYTVERPCISLSKAWGPQSKMPHAAIV